MRFRPWLLFLIIGTLFQSSTFGQERCGFSHLQKKTQQLRPTSERDFENWIAAKIRQKSKLRTKATYDIPVVIHIVHNGEAVGSGFNISDSQIQSQIEVLNKDYQRLNEDQVNTPAEFAGVAAGLDIEFVLARQDPEGLPSTGIVRVRGNKSGWTMANELEFKSQSYWPAEDYLNIWVVNLTDEYLGFAQFPEDGSLVPGVEGPYDALTDGVVIDTKVFGTRDAGNFDLDEDYDKGRTATHEVGHFLGLLHIFGGCSTSGVDFVTDTPPQQSSTLTCPTHPTATTGCGSHNKMFQNYMDYTDDACMNLFTAGQLARVITVLDNSPRRSSLSTSSGLQTPVVLALDLEAKRVIVPTEMTCGQGIVPQVELRNRGSTLITSAQIRLIINGSIVETKTFALSLSHLATGNVSFSALNLPETGIANMTFEIFQVNGGSDNKSNNNSIALAVQVLPRTTVPFTETFNSTPSTWQVINPDRGTSWANVNAPKTTANNRAMRMEMWPYENTGSKDQLLSNAIVIPATGVPVLKFDRAYANAPNNNSDALRVLVSVGCSADLSLAVEIFNKSGVALATAGPTSAYFTPSGESQWLTETISMAAYKGLDIQLIFETTNGYGNNLYLDNISVSAGEFNDIAINSLVWPTGPVFCEATVSPQIQVQNLGSSFVSRITATTKLDGATINILTIQNVNLNPGSTTTLSLDGVTLPTEGVHTVQFSISNPDAVQEESPDNNVLSTKWLLNTDLYASPLRVNLDNMITISSVSPKATQTWETVSTNFDNSFLYKGHDNPVLGEQAWAVTPTVDLSATTEGSFFFTTSYGSRTTGQERLRVLVSENCGLHYVDTLFDQTSAMFANAASAGPWVPASESDWTTHYLSLNDYAGKDRVRFAFVVENGNGNNLYLDNLEWFIEDDPTPPRTEEPFVVYSSETNPHDFLITFNLPQKEPVRLVVYNVMGQLLIDNVLPESLNQTYTVNLYGQSTGVYLVKIQTGATVSTTKLFVGN